MRPNERQAPLSIQKQRNFPLVQLETLATLSPAKAGLRHLGLPLPIGFADQIRVCERPVVFMVEQGVFASRALQVALADGGIRLVAMENTVGLIDLLVQQANYEAKAHEKAKTSGLWKMLGALSDEAPQDPPLVSKIIVARFSGNLAQAEAFDGRIRHSLPAAVCYLVSGIDALAEAVRSCAPISLASCATMPVAGGIIADSAHPVVERKEPRLLLCDNNKALLEAYAQTLARRVTTSFPSMTK